MKTTLQEFKDELARELFGMTLGEALGKGACISCKNLVSLEGEDLAEYKISGLCPECFPSGGEDEY